MDQMVRMESLCNHNDTNTFLPHVTLFSGEQLSTEDSEAVFCLFRPLFPKGLPLRAMAFRENADINPPAQLIFAPTTEEDAQKLHLFQQLIEMQLGLEIKVNLRWLHATLMYKNIEHSIAKASTEIAKVQTHPILNQVFLFDQYAITTGRAWNPADIAAWENVRSRPLCAPSMRDDASA